MCLPVIFVLALLVSAASLAQATAISINVTPSVVHVGDTVTFQGNI